MKSKKIIIVVVSMIVILLGIFIQQTPEEIIRKSFKYTNNKNLEKLKEYHTEGYKNTDFRLFNINNIKVTKINLITDNERYNGYFSCGNGREKNLDKDDIKIFNVEYHIEYYDEKLEPQDSGDTQIHYTLIKEKGKWKIDGIGD
ncbi:MAG: DUF4829 domain-containing protein [Clostridium sp.]|uniref:DUF4829 domain-containing protein n=1 Tax=Clostridium sp. TaxID=1506 RepID=UPI003F3FA1E4